MEYIFGKEKGRTQYRYILQLFTTGTTLATFTPQQQHYQHSLSQTPSSLEKIQTTLTTHIYRYLSKTCITYCQQFSIKLHTCDTGRHFFQELPNDHLHNTHVHHWGNTINVNNTTLSIKQVINLAEHLLYMHLLLFQFLFIFNKETTFICIN